jgi:heptosyltransferase III
VLKYLRQRCPGARLSFMVPHDLVELFRDQDYADEAISYQNRLLPLRAALSRGRYDAVLMLKPSKAIAWASLFAGVRSKAGLGWRPYYPLTGFRSGSLRVAGGDPREADANLAVAYALFPGSAGSVVPDIRIPGAEKNEACQRLSRHSGQRPIAILPASRGSAPNWPPGRYAGLAEALQRHGYETVVLGGTGEERTLSHAAASSGTPVLGPGGSILQIAALLSQCRLAIASSTGTLHLAAAVGVPTIGLFCPVPARRPQRWAPAGTSHIQIVPRDRRCPGCDGAAGCDLSGITIDEVLAAVEQLK